MLEYSSYGFITFFYGFITRLLNLSLDLVEDINRNKMAYRYHIMFKLIRSNRQLRNLALCFVFNTAAVCARFGGRMEVPFCEQ